MKNKEQTNACYGCFGAANGDCDECAKDRSEYYADWTEHSDSCDEWKGRE